MELKAEQRTLKGKSGVKKLRYKEKVPAILYGHNETPVMLQIAEKDTEHLKEGEHLIVDFGKTGSPDKVDTIIKEIQWDPINSTVLNIDFLRLKKGQKVKIKVALLVEGMQEVIKKGGIVEHKLSEIEMECLPQDIPDVIKVNVSNLNIGQSLSVKDLPEIKGTLLEKPETLVLSILAPKKEEEVKPEEAVLAEGEVPAEAGAEGAVAAEAGAEAKPGVAGAKPAAGAKPGAAGAKPTTGAGAGAKPEAKAGTKPAEGKPKGK